MDDSNFVSIVFGIFVIFIIVMIAAALNANKQHELRNFARHWNGRLHEAGLFGGSHVELDFGGVVARVDYTNSEDESLTHLTVPLRLPLGRMKLRPQHWGDEVGKFLGLEDIEIGVPGFDELFIIQGSSPKEIIKLLSEPVRSAILGIKRMAHGSDHVHLSVGSGILRVSLGTSLSTEAELSEFVQKCRVLFDLLNPNSGQGIEFLASGTRGVGNVVSEQTVPEEAECQVCGTPLKENIVHCLKCKTPHHRDCWQYFGSCSVYGCGQKRFVEFGKR